MNIMANEYICLLNKNNELALINDSMEYVAQVVSAPAILDRKKGIINPPRPHPLQSNDEGTKEQKCVILASLKWAG